MPEILRRFAQKFQLRYQACDDRECYLPQTLEFDLPIQVLPHDWERLE